MKRIFIFAVVASLAYGGQLSLLEFPGAKAEQERPLTDDEIRDLLIKQSIARYSGSCPCPYSTMRNGARCGGRSAYSKPGGASPLCYRSDIPKDMVENYRKRK